jgi:hypothetical protein
MEHVPAFCFAFSLSECLVIRGRLLYEVRTEYFQPKEPSRSASTHRAFKQSKAGRRLQLFASPKLECLPHVASGLETLKTGNGGATVGAGAPRF